MSRAFAELPNVQLHCHLEGTIGAATFRGLAARYAVDIGERNDPEKTFAFSTFMEFLYLFRAVLSVMRSPDDYAATARDYVASAREQGVRHAELHISPSAWKRLHPELDVRATVGAIRAALDAESAGHDMTTGLIVDLTRNFGVESAEASAREAVTLADLGVVAVGLGGAEADWPPELFVDAFAIARAGGLHTVAHAGEAAGAASVRGAVETLGAERIGHGVRALEDPAVVELLVRRQIPLEICPTSNRLTGAAPAGMPHQLADLDAAGCRIALDADDPTLFGTTLLEEYGLAADWLGAGAIPRFVENAIRASFASASRKAQLLAMLPSRNSVVSGRIKD
jgi:adenosine deaminase